MPNSLSTLLSHPSIPASLLVLPLICCLAASAQEGTASAASPQVLVVDCGRGEGIDKALRRARRLTGPLEIEVHGICEESVVIDRPLLTLRGSDPATDGIRGDGRRPATVTLDHVWEVRIEDLSLIAPDTLTGTALVIGDSFSIDVARCRAEGVNFGALGSRSNFSIEDTTFIGGFAALQAGGGAAGCSRCTLDGADGRALRIENGRFTLEDSSLEARIAVQINTGGSATIRRSTLRALPDQSGRLRAISVAHASRLSLQDSSVVGTFFATEQSVILLHGVTQSFGQPSPESHGLQLDSVLRTSGATSLEGDLLLSDLAEAIIGDGTALGGDLVCGPSSQAWCSGTVSVAGSNCSECPIP